MYKQTPAERLVTLTCCLLSRPSLGLSKNELFQAVTAYAQAGSDAAREKMFDRDKNAIREAGFILEVIGNDGFEDTDSARYRIQNSSFSWPEDFELTPQMLQLLEIASKAWNNQAMGQSARSGIMRLRSLGLIPISTDLAMLSPRLLAQHPAFAPLANSIAVGQKVSFNYRKADLTEQIREVSPQKLRQLAGEWVLLADDDGQIKNFLLRRIVSNVVELTDPAKQVSEAEIIQAEAELLIHVENQVARVEIAPDTEAFWHYNPGPDLIVEINYMDEALLAEDLMEYGSDLLVLEPDSLAERISESLLRVVKQHA